MLLSEVQFHIGMDVSFKNAMDAERTLDMAFQTKLSLLLNPVKLEAEVERQPAHLIDKIEKFVRKGSGYTVSNINEIITLFKFPR